MCPWVQCATFIWILEIIFPSHYYFICMIYSDIVKLCNSVPNIQAHSMSCGNVERCFCKHFYLVPLKKSAFSQRNIKKNEENTYDDFVIKIIFK